MKREIDRLKKEQFDILVIGGGINGAAIARDASLRGAKVALLEKNDFASGASGKTTKLIHGGLRYLEQFNFKLVYESLRERAILLKTAAYLVKPLEFIIPVYKDDPRPLWKIKTAVSIYTWLSGASNIRPHQFLSKDELSMLEGGVASYKMQGGVIYWDAQMDDARLCLDNVISAYQAGSCIANKIEAVGFIKEKGRITGVSAIDKLTGEPFSVFARIIISAAGAWSNQIVKMDEPQVPPIVRPTKGIHIIYRPLPSSRAILFSARQDKRMLFVIPWRNLTLIGSTDTDYTGSPDEVYAEEGEVEYLLKEVRRLFPAETVDKSGIIATYAGLRPLVNTQCRPSWQVSREHLIRESKSGLITVAGGKYTTYRLLAKQVVDLTFAKLEGRNFRRCSTQTQGPSGGEDVLYKKDGGAVDLPKAIEYAVREEMAYTLDDLLKRRLPFEPAHFSNADYIKECAEIMARCLCWSSQRKESEITLYKEELQKNMIAGI